jgi:hypothetical protein
MEIINTEMVSIEALLFRWRIENRTTNTVITQNSVTLSLRPRFDHKKWLGRKEKMKNRP